MSWHVFDAWCAERNVDPLALPMGRLVNLFERWLLLHLKEDDRKAYVEAIDGMRKRSERAAIVAEVEAVADGPAPARVPSWWHGDEEAAATSMAAVAQLRRGKG